MFNICRLGTLGLIFLLSCVQVMNSSLNNAILNNNQSKNRNTANFLMVVSPAVLAHDVSARAGDVSMGISVFPIGWIYSGLFEKLKDG